MRTHTHTRALLNRGRAPGSPPALEGQQIGSLTQTPAHRQDSGADQRWVVASQAQNSRTPTSCGLPAAQPVFAELLGIVQEVLRVLVGG